VEITADKRTITGTDATDDCHLTVTIVDAQRKPVAHCELVTLTIVSGPGEFPTGRSITFTPDSDIRITAGRCGIEFRSYHAGETLICATSPGLADATITITTSGEIFYAGQAAPDRPYTPPPVSPAAVSAISNAVNVALNRPSRASSETEHHPARFANDGDEHSFWFPASNDSAIWWQVDLEGFYQISSGMMLFAVSDMFRFRIDTSEDGENWALAIDRMNSTCVTNVRNNVYPPGTIARYVRFSFARPAPICEIQILGVLSPAKGTS
jgi:beta-galactosidase